MSPLDEASDRKGIPANRDTAEPVRRLESGSVGPAPAEQTRP
jgi:hypothetical protein